jgi:hypothetical protein
VAAPAGRGDGDAATAGATTPGEGDATAAGEAATPGDGAVAGAGEALGDVAGEAAAAGFVGCGGWVAAGAVVA